MSDDWRPYDPSLEAERRAVYERAARRAFTFTIDMVYYNPKSREWFDRVFGEMAQGGHR